MSNAFQTQILATGRIIEEKSETEKRLNELRRIDEARRVRCCELERMLGCMLEQARRNFQDYHGENESACPEWEWIGLTKAEFEQLINK